jgi:hypothetical protein
MTLAQETRNSIYGAIPSTSGGKAVVELLEDLSDGALCATKAGFFGTTPIAQPAGAAQAEVAAITGGESPSETEFNALVAEVNALRKALVDLGLIKGSA